MQKLIVNNMTSPRSGREVANQFIIDADDGTYFQSYNTMIAVITNAGVKLDAKAWDYSRTTSKYRNEFLQETTKETLAKIKDGTYELADLN